MSPSLRAKRRRPGILAIPLIKALTTRVARDAPAAAGYVHWGATSQDAIDSGLARQIRGALEQIDTELAALSCTLERLAERHAQRQSSDEHGFSMQCRLPSA